MKDKFIVVEEDSIFYPQRFITRNDEAGKYRVEDYKLQGNEKLVIVEFNRVNK